MASHMPAGGLDSSSLVEAPRNRLAIPLDEPVFVVVLPLTRGIDSADVLGAAFSSWRFAMALRSPNNESRLKSVCQVVQLAKFGR